MVTFSFVDQHGSQHLLGESHRRRRAGPRGSLCGREAHRGPGGDVAERRRNGRRGRPRCQRRCNRRRWQGEPPSCKSAPQLVTRPGQAAAHRAGRAAQATGRLVEREAFEVAEHDRQSKRSGQAIDLAVEDFGLLASQKAVVRPAGRRLGQDARARSGMTHHGGLFILAPASELDTRLARRAERDPVEPVSQQIRIADRPGLASQDEEDGLERILGVVEIAQSVAGRYRGPSARGGSRARRRQPRLSHRAGRRIARSARGRSIRRRNRRRTMSRSVGLPMTLPQAAWSRAPWRTRSTLPSYPTAFYANLYCPAAGHHLPGCA